ncbi:MAG: hypothetical protein R8M46_02165 [Ghiorsea sp.]
MKFITLIFIIFVSQSVSAATFKDISKTKLLSDQIMQHFIKEEFVKGLNIAKNYWPLPPVEIDGLANTINTQWSIVKQRFGTPTGIEFIRKERLGESFIRLFYLHKFENHAIYWVFTFYKPNNEWKINGISFKDDFGFLFKPVE